MTRRDLLLSGGAMILSRIGTPASRPLSTPDVRLTDCELIPIRATQRTVWLIVRLGTSTGIQGLGEASDAFGFANTTAGDAAVMRGELERFFKLVEGRSVFDIEFYRQQGIEMARQSLVAATAFSAIEQAMWDLAGQSLEVPAYVLFGGKVRDSLPVYANINRATLARTPQGFADAARRATRDGFGAAKAAPFDGFPGPDTSVDEVEDAVENGIASVTAIREAVGTDVGVMIDCHSFFDVALAERVARRLERENLTWYEEPVPPGNIPDTLEIGERISQPMAGGELLFGLAGFAPLIESRVFDVIMPDVKHCGGLLELTRIAAAAGNRNVMVAPHNPSGPVSTAASSQVCAGMGNFTFLELQYGEVDWRSDLLAPGERFDDGRALLPEAPGFGIELDESVMRERSLPL